MYSVFPVHTYYMASIIYSDPPLDPLHLPEGEWVCHGCRPSPSNMEDHPNEIFRPLLIQGCSENPLVFSLPEDMMNIVAVKGI